jgi:hypothetical protein
MQTHFCQAGRKNRWIRIMRILGLTLTWIGAQAAIPLTDSPVAHWNELALDSIRAAATPPPKASRILAMLHVAIHDAYNGVHRNYEQYLVDAHEVDSHASGHAALAVAAHDVLVNAFPLRAAEFDAEAARQLRWGRDARGRQEGIRWGARVARTVLAARQADGATTIVNYVPTGLPGDWEPTPLAFAPGLLPQWGDVQPFGVGSAEAFLPMPPPPLDSLAYAEDVAEVQAIGSANSAVRTADQTLVARFWANGAGTSTPPGHWNQIARQIIASGDVRLGEEARMMALLNVALADAAIVCWKAKYEYRLWRPITAIREADTDGNPATVVDPGWTPLLPTPPFPEYTSGHSTFSGAGATVLAQLFGTDAIAFVGESDDAPGILRPFSGFWEAAEESGMSRIYGGIHFMAANVNGLSSGRAVGLAVVRNWMRPLDGEDDDRDEDDESKW